MKKDQVPVGHKTDTRLKKDAFRDWIDSQSFEKSSPDAKYWIPKIKQTAKNLAAKLISNGGIRIHHTVKIIVWADWTEEWQKP